MAENSTIEWLEGGSTWPVIRGCSKISSGCDNCWAIRDAHLHARGNSDLDVESVSPKARARVLGAAKAAAHFRGLTVIQNGRPNWSGEVRVDESILELPLKWKRPRKIFVASSGDLFHERLPNGQRSRVCEVMAKTPQHTYLMLTKRAQVMQEFFQHWKLPANWWPGVSVEDEPNANARLPWLLKIAGGGPHWVSYEPALGQVDWRRLLSRHCAHCGGQHRGKPYEIECSWCSEQGFGVKRTVGIDWIVIGGESGPRSRAFDLAWAKSTIDQCKAAAVRVFMKQMGAKPDQTVKSPIDGYEWQRPVVLKDRKGATMAEWPEWARVREFPGDRSMSV